MSLEMGLSILAGLLLIMSLLWGYECITMHKDNNNRM